MHTLHVIDDTQFNVRTLRTLPVWTLEASA